MTRRTSRRGGRVIRGRLAGWGLLALAAAWLPSPAAAQGKRLDAGCTVSILNRTAQVQPDGSWQLFNVPANFGPVRARATCVENGVTVSGQSSYITVQPNAVTGVDARIPLGPVDPIPAALTITAPTLALTQPQATTQLQVTATFPDGSTADVTGATGTTYTVSNPVIASVSPGGLVTALAAGNVFVAAMKDGALAVVDVAVEVPSIPGANGDDLGQALQSVQVTPNPVALTVNAVLGEATQQLKVTGTLIDGTSLDLTSSATGTLYSSSDLTQCNFGGVDGLVFAATSFGSCVITVTNSGFSVQVPVTINSFSPALTGNVTLPGAAGGVAVSGNLAYLAAGSSGLLVIDVTNHAAPRLLDTVATPGSALAVKVVGARAYVADGPGGLQIYDLTVPTAPLLLGGVVTPTDAKNLVVRGDLAYVADSATGLQIVDVSVPAAPVLLGSAPAPSGASATGVDVDAVRGLAFVTTVPYLQVLDVSDPGRPVPLSTLTLFAPENVVVQGSVALVADGEASMTSVDVSSPAAPQVLSRTPVNVGGLDLDLAVVKPFAFGADGRFLAPLPIVDFSDPTNLRQAFQITLPSFINGRGIAADDLYVYLSAEAPNTLYVGQYLSLADPYGVPPTVAISSPASGATAVQGSQLTMVVQASDDVAVASVDFLVNGQVAATSVSPPYQFTLTVPTGATSVVLGAQAHDLGGLSATAAPVTVTVVADPLTEAAGQLVDSTGAPVAGASVAANGGVEGTSLADGTFSIPGVPTIRGAIFVTATATVGGVAVSGTSASVPPVPGGVTNVGTVSLTAPTACVTGALVYGGTCFTTQGAPVTSPANLVLVANGTTTPAGTVTPDPTGRFCAVLRRNAMYELLQSNPPSCSGPPGGGMSGGTVGAVAGGTRGCTSSTLQLTDPNASGQCADPAPSCQDLGTITLTCNFFAGS
jgi:hypothetical protein